MGFYWRVVDGKTEIVPCSCKRYDCPHCGKVRKAILLDKIHNGAARITNDKTKPRSHRIVRSLTLTQHIEDPHDIMEEYNRFRLYLRKRGYIINYFWVKEFTQKGKRHLHILINRFIPQAVIAACWKQASFGWSYIVHITRADMGIRRPAGYMAKYVSKAIHESQFKKHEHRYGHDHEIDWSHFSSLCPGEHKWKFEKFPAPFTNLHLDRADLPGPTAGSGPPG